MTLGAGAPHPSHGIQYNLISISGRKHQRPKPSKRPKPWQVHPTPLQCGRTMILTTIRDGMLTFLFAVSPQRMLLRHTSNADTDMVNLVQHHRSNLADSTAPLKRTPGKVLKAVQCPPLSQCAVYSAYDINWLTWAASVIRIFAIQAFSNGLSFRSVRLSGSFSFTSITSPRTGA